MNRKEWKGWNDLPKAIEGNTGRYPKYQEFMFNLLQATGISKIHILEIGFNAGHSACCFLNAMPDATMMTFDICHHKTVAEGFKVLSDHFDIDLVAGDSTKTIPTFIKENPNVMFDFAFIDGGHKGNIPLLDIQNVAPIVKVGGIMVIDDMNISDVVKAVGKFNWSDWETLEIPKIEKSIRVFKKIK